MAKDYESYRSEYIVDSHDMLAEFVHQANSMTPIEGITFLYLTRLRFVMGTAHLKVEPQFKIDNYTVDFLLRYVMDGKTKTVIVECDGHDFHEKTKEQVSKDKKRDRHLVTGGHLILRFSGSEIVSDPDAVIQSIIRLLVKKN